MTTSCMIQIIAYNVFNLNMHVSSYSVLCASYVFFLTLSVTKVSFERVFSKVELVKTRLKANISQDNLEALLMMSVKKQLLNEIEISNITDYLKASSTVFSKMFSL